MPRHRKEDDEPDALELEDGPDDPEPEPEPEPDDGTEPAKEPEPEPPPAETPASEPPPIDPGDPSLPGRPKEGDNASERPKPAQASMRPAPAAWRGPIAPRSAPPVENPIGSVAMASGMTGAGVQGFPTAGLGSGLIFSGLGQAPTAAAFARLAP